MGKKERDDDYLKVMSSQASLILDVSFELFELGRAFSRTGNSSCGDHLCGLAVELSEAQEKINSAVSRDIGRQCLESRERSATILKTALLSNEISGRK